MDKTPKRRYSNRWEALEDDEEEDIMHLGEDHTGWEEVNITIVFRSCRHCGTKRRGYGIPGTVHRSIEVRYVLSGSEQYQDRNPREEGIERVHQ